MKPEDWKPAPQKIPPGTVAAIAASLMAQGESFGNNSDLWWSPAYRRNMVQQFVKLAREIADETIRQELQP